MSRSFKLGATGGSAAYSRQPFVFGLLQVPMMCYALRMNKKAIIVALIFPLGMAVISFIEARTASDGFGAIAASIGVSIALVATVFTGAILFIFRRHIQYWWHGILISVAGLAIAFGLLIAYGFYSRLSAPPAIPNSDQENGIVGSILMNPRCAIEEKQSNPACATKQYGNVAVRIVNTKTGTVVTTMADAGGEFRSPALPKGKYTVVVVPEGGTSGPTCEPLTIDVTGGYLMSAFITCTP